MYFNGIPATCVCSAQSGNLRNLEIALRILRIRKLRTNLEIAQWVYAISRSRGTGAQSRDSAISVACTIEPIEFPLYIKVKDVCNKLLQLCRHLQCRACILKPPHRGLLGSSPTRRNSLPLGLGTGAERSQTCGVPPFKASPSLTVLNSILLVSSDALTPLAQYVRKLRSRNLKIECAISRLVRNFRILRMRSAISRLRKFLNCAEHIHPLPCPSFQPPHPPQ